jgi:hypothetical protein
VRVNAELQPQLSRWLWLVKWLLVIPHALILGFLWVAFLVITLVAGVAILFTGRYPRSLFDFAVGVLRWQWRVTFYALTLGTDRYPPFSLGPDPDYPAHLEVAYPERLSRPLVLVKWLLALPHLIIVALFGGLTWSTWWGAAWIGNDDRVGGGIGIAGLLALVAGVILLFTGNYPVAIFDLIVGMQRWTLRVTAYVALLRDEYPPFRLDQGGAEPGTPPPAGGPPPPGSAALPTPSGTEQPVGEDRGLRPPL